MRQRLPLAALPVLAALAFSACGSGGGCGGEDSSNNSGSSSPSTSGGASPRAGGGSINLADWDSQKKEKPSTLAQPPSQPETAPAQAASGPLQPVGPDDWQAKVVKASSSTFVLVAGANCSDCDIVTPALKALAPDFPAWTFYRLDGSAAGAAKLLPKGMGVLPLPGFLMYEKTWARSRKQGMPFARSKDETVADYQARLQRWFRDALTQKSFAFAKR